MVSWIGKALKDMKKNLMEDIEQNFITSKVALGQYWITNKKLIEASSSGLVEMITVWKRVFYRETDIGKVVLANKKTDITLYYKVTLYISLVWTESFCMSSRYSCIQLLSVWDWIVFPLSSSLLTSSLQRGTNWVIHLFPYCLFLILWYIDIDM